MKGSHTYSTVRHCAIAMPMAIPNMIVRAMPAANGHRLSASALARAPLSISCSAAAKIALGGAMKIGSIRRP
jgi:hypothetical protein